MRVSPDLMELVQLLEEEGFGFLAGELLTEISLGREIDLDESDSDEKRTAKVDAAERFPDSPVPRKPIEEAEQLAAAMEFLRLRLVEPMRRLAEAERIAGALLREQSEKTGEIQPPPTADAVRILFISAQEENTPLLERTEREGHSETADDLAAILQELSGSSG